MKLHVHTLTWICGLVGCQPSSVAINFLDHVTKWAPHDAHHCLVPPHLLHLLREQMSFPRYDLVHKT